MSGRLRVVVIDAEGDAGDRVIAAALALLGPGRGGEVEAVAQAAVPPAVSLPAPEPQPRRKPRQPRQARKVRRAKANGAAKSRRGSPPPLRGRSSVPDEIRDAREGGNPAQRSRPSSTGDGGRGRTEQAETHAGITVDPTPGAESIRFLRGEVISLTARQAALALLLARAAPAPVDYAFLIRKLGIGGEYAQTQLCSLASQLRVPAAAVDLAVTTTRGVGIALAPADVKE